MHTLGRPVERTTKMHGGVDGQFLTSHCRQRLDNPCLRNAVAYCGRPMLKSPASRGSFASKPPSVTKSQRFFDELGGEGVIEKQRWPDDASRHRAYAEMFGSTGARWVF